jgi:hypothetical protein
MNITGGTNVELVGRVLSGFYYLGRNKGVKPKIFEFSSPTYEIGNFQQPYDAILPSPNSTTGVTAAARRLKRSTDTISSDRSGKLYYYDRADMYGVCHGYGRGVLTSYTGFNFYPAFYPAGYFAPPYGENVSIFKSNEDGVANLFNGTCATLNLTEYNEQFGIVSRVASDISLTTNTLTANTYAQITSPRETCPPEIAITNYFDEIQYHQILGASAQMGAGTFYNGNPIPTSLDIYNISVNGRYEIVGTDPNREIVFVSGRGKPSYSSDSNHNILNNTLCYAGIMETNVGAGRGTNGAQLIETPDLLSFNTRNGDQVVFSQGIDTAFFYWHFTFKENTTYLPFYNNFASIDTSTTKTQNRTISQGTLLFLPELSSEDSYWQNRQCPDTVDFLPWTFGASIYACPSEHFDIPYYAATKKFGFYGTRFLNSCNALNLDNTWHDVPLASEMPESAVNVPIAKPDLEPDDIDREGSWSFSVYDNLIRTAKAEERYSNMYALNKGFFFWANSGLILADENYRKISGEGGFHYSFNSLIQKFQEVFTGGLSSFVSGEPKVIMQSGNDGVYPVEDGAHADLLLSNEAYEKFWDEATEQIPQTGFYYLRNLEDKYAYFISDGIGIHETFYRDLVTGREKRLLTRYLENSVQGNPIDLYPLNHIYFSFDHARSYLENPLWGRGMSPFHKTTLAEIPRRYFEGAYSDGHFITGLVQKLNSLAIDKDSYFYPGFFNYYKIGKGLPKPVYLPVLSGTIVDNQGHRFSPSGWLALGYNEIGALDKNFSCFTPLFVQQPLDKVFTKIGQAPTFRSKAVDYHTIPDDKMSYRYPEIIYWAYKLKLLDSQFTNLYPLKYKWLRVLKTEYANFLATGDIASADFASATGEWGCIEGDGPNCTMIHPKACSPVGQLGNSDSYTFIKGAQAGVDDLYSYISMASGRFGIRLSEPSNLVIEDWVKFDVSVKNGMNAASNIQIDFEVNDINNATHTISFTSDSNSAYYGYQQDISAIPEAVVEQKIPPPNAGFGDVTAFRFIGPIGYIGASRSYQPPTLKDTRGLRESWGRFIEYGALVSLSKRLSQTDGELMYGYKHLPTCANYEMAPGKKGIKVIGKMGSYFMSHWTLPQQAVASTDNKIGIKWDKLDVFGALYPPMTQGSLVPDKNGKFATANPGNDPLLGSYGIGHWQWGNNLGAIKRFGFLSNKASDDLAFVGADAPSAGQITDELINKVKKKLIFQDDLAGDNCGFSPFGLGRHMIYYLEAYERFYVLCDLIKKKNVKNKSFICPGLRALNSSVQYNWLGHPHNTYLERRAMYGPYAYQWKVKRHNRDRNGNGMSEGFYSMGWSRRYSLMYDAPAIFGLYVRLDPSIEYKGKVSAVETARKTLFGNTAIDFATYRRSWFGVRGNNESSKRYGDYFCSCEEGDAVYSQTMCAYLDAAKSLGANPDLYAYTCTEEQLALGKCFDPCLSMRYGQGLLPGGKYQNLFGYSNSTSANLATPRNVKLVNTASLDATNNIILNDEQSSTDKSVYFRAPVNTPHARVMRGLVNIGTTYSEQVMGFSPCRDGGSDHCNFTTPTVHLKTSTVLITSASAFMVAQNYAANLYETYNIRGEE